MKYQTLNIVFKTLSNIILFVLITFAAYAALTSGDIAELRMQGLRTEANWIIIKDLLVAVILGVLWISCLKVSILFGDLIEKEPSTSANPKTI